MGWNLVEGLYGIWAGLYLRQETPVNSIPDLTAFTLWVFQQSPCSFFPMGRG
jgi:hypothetical protein